tara:strand:- start:7755 stop:8114 length:360 start_codon:yes stop_codon:yes gene_type:complete
LNKMGRGKTKKLNSEVMREAITKTLEDLDVDKEYLKLKLYDKVIVLYQDIYKDKYGKLNSQLSHRSSSPKKRISQFFREKICNEHGWKTVYRRRIGFIDGVKTQISYLNTPYLVRIKNE